MRLVESSHKYTDILWQIQDVKYDVACLAEIGAMLFGNFLRP
jgi:hypothetical protein